MKTSLPMPLIGRSAKLRNARLEWRYIHFLYSNNRGTEETSIRAGNNAIIETHVFDFGTIVVFKRSEKDKFTLGLRLRIILAIGPRHLLVPMQR